MKGDVKVIEALNAVLTNELTAINQYFLHARIADSQGYKAIAKKIYDESIEEMKHAQLIIDRILLLEGLPNLQKLHGLTIGETVPEMLKADLAVEVKGREDLKAGIKVCFDAVCHGSRDLFEKILVESEDHIDWLESQLGIIQSIGAQNYLAQHIKD
jgi:bacterioferritin